MDKTKFLYATAGLDSEGFTLERYDHPLGQTIAHHMANLIEDQRINTVLADAGLTAMLQASFDGEAGTYSDPKCALCPHPMPICVTASRTELCGNSHCKDGCYVLAIQNPKGWREVDGVKLPSVATWAQQGTLPTLTGWSDEALDAGLASWKAEGVRIVGERRKVRR